MINLTSQRSNVWDVYVHNVRTKRVQPIELCGKMGTVSVGSFWRSSRKASPPIGWYQIILLGDRGTCVLTTCPGLHSIADRPGFELATYWSQVQRPNHSATEPHLFTITIVLAVAITLTLSIILIDTQPVSLTSFFAMADCDGRPGESAV